jgi:hypothetical protein
MRRALGTAAVAMLLACTLASEAKAPAVSIGRITSEVAKKPELSRALASAVKSELRKLDLSSAKERFVLSASLVRLDAVTEDNRVEVTAEVNGELARKVGGSVRAVFRGRARASDAKSAAKSTELAALEGAVRSAMKNLPQAVR